MGAVPTGQTHLLACPTLQRTRKMSILQSILDCRVQTIGPKRNSFKPLTLHRKVDALRPTPRKLDICWLCCEELIHHERCQMVNPYASLDLFCISSCYRPSKQSPFELRLAPPGTCCCRLHEEVFCPNSLEPDSPSESVAMAENPS